MAEENVANKLVTAKMRKAVDACEDFVKTLGNQQTLYGLNYETIIAIKESLFYLGELKERCLGRLVKPEFVRSKQTHSASNTAAKKAFKEAKKPTAPLPDLAPPCKITEKDV